MERNDADMRLQTRNTLWRNTANKVKDLIRRQFCSNFYLLLHNFINTQTMLNLAAQ